MEGFMKAKDLMVPLREYLKPDNTLKDAANLLRIAQRGEEKIGVKALFLTHRGISSEYFPSGIFSRLYILPICI
jgi:hypothetical protein